MTLFHVNQETDQNLRTIKDEVYDRENRAIVAVIGELGAGKTERLRVTAAEAREQHAFCVYFDIAEKTPGVLRGLAQEFRKAAQEFGLIKTFGGPGWVRPIQALEKLKDESYDPSEAGQTIGRALNESAPALLLLNDVHNLIDSREVDAFVKVLQEVADSIKPGVLVIFSCYTSYLAWLTVNHPAFAQRINRKFLLRRFSDDEAALLLAKKLLAKRVVEDLDPTYPFDSEAVSALNSAANGNPRRLLELADLAIEYALAHRAYRVDAEMVRAVIPATPDRAPPSGPTLVAPPRAPVVPLKPGTPPPKPNYLETGAA
ncbi:MAG TPA: AAA family ATPase [Thermoplasmata archaeon]|nr:AAA family ATPase [Thermoplasmata archaeon]